MRELLKLEKVETLLLCLVLITFSFLRLPSLFEPYWYGDEGIYQTLGMGINNGRMLYQEIWDNKPPILYLLYAFTSSSQFNIRFLSLIFGLVSTIVFYLLSKNLFKNKKAAFISTFIFAFLFGIPLLEGNIANAENFMILPTLLAGLIIYRITEPRLSSAKLSASNSKFIIAGFLLSLSFLTKIVAIFDLAAFILFIIFLTYKDKKSLLNIVKKISPLLFGFLTPILLTFVYFWLNNAFAPFYQATFTQMVGYVGYGNKLVVPQGFLILKMILLFLFSLFLFFKKDRLEKSLIFILLWLSFSIFNALFSARPYIHYLLVLLPSFCLIAGLIFEKPYRKVAIIFSTVIIIITLLSFSFYKKTIYYYPNFISFITNKKNVHDYYSFFDRNTPRDYELAEFIKAKTKNEDSIFLWGNNAQVYTLTNKLPPGRLTVLYHMTANKNTIEETKKAIEQKRPKFIILMPSNQPLFYSLSNYRYSLTIVDSQIYERIY